MTHSCYIVAMALATQNACMEFRIRNIPSELYKRFKILCVQEEKTVNQKLIELMQEAVEKGKPEK